MTIRHGDEAPDGREVREHPPVDSALRHLERFPMGSSYTEIRDRDGSNYRVPKKDLVSVTQVLLQTGRLKIARALPHAELLARELVNFRSRLAAQTVESQLDWRERANDDLVLALAIAAWQAEQNPGLGFSCSYGVS